MSTTKLQFSMSVLIAAFLLGSNSVNAHDNEMHGYMVEKAKEILSAQTSKANRFVTAEGLNEALFNADRGDTSAYFILDMRSPEDYCAGHIGAANDANIPIQKVGLELDKLPMDQPIVTICPSGQSASYVTAVLQMLGFDAYALQNGMNNWIKSELPLQTCE